MELLGANSEAQLSGSDSLPGVTNYFIGHDPSKWHTNIRTYSKVEYRSLYPSVDAVFYGNQRQLEYDFVVAPGADAGAIALEAAGIHPALDAKGDIVLKTAGGNLLLHKPVVYQGSGDSRTDSLRSSEREICSPISLTCEQRLRMMEIMVQQLP